jgi:hypothetical protein
MRSLQRPTPTPRAPLRELRHPATDESMFDLAARLREVRTRRGKSVREWATLLTDLGYPIAWNTPPRYERGELAVPASYVLMVAKVTGASPDWLLTGKGQPPRGAA